MFKIVKFLLRLASDLKTAFFTKPNKHLFPFTALNLVLKHDENILSYLLHRINLLLLHFNNTCYILTCIILTDALNKQ